MTGESSCWLYVLLLFGFGSLDAQQIIIVMKRCGQAATDKLRTDRRDALGKLLRGVVYATSAFACAVLASVRIIRPSTEPQRR